MRKKEVGQKGDAGKCCPTGYEHYVAIKAILFFHVGIVVS